MEVNGRTQPWLLEQLLLPLFSGYRECGCQAVLMLISFMAKSVMGQWVSFQKEEEPLLVPQQYSVVLRW